MQKLVASYKAAKGYSTVKLAQDAFEASGYNRDNMSAVYEGGFDGVIRVQIIGPLGSFLGWLR